MRRAFCLVVMFLAGADVVAQSHDKPAAHPAPAKTPPPAHAAPAAPAKTAPAAHAAPVKPAPGAHAAAAKEPPAPAGSDADLLRVAKAIAAAVVPGHSEESSPSHRTTRRPPSARAVPRYAVRWPSGDIRWSVAWPVAPEGFTLSWPDQVEDTVALQSQK